MTFDVVAVVGSREGADLAHVERFLRELHAKYPGARLVSGGNNSVPGQSVDFFAEQLWLSLGGAVTSFRPTQIESGHWLIERWEGSGGQFRAVRRLDRHPSWADFKSAATYRDMLIAEEAEVVVAFYRSGKSRGAAFTIEAGQNEEKPTYEFERVEGSGNGT